MGTSNFKSVNQIGVVERENDVSDFASLELSASSLLTVDLCASMFGIRRVSPLWKLSLDHLTHVLLEGEGGCLSSLEATTWATVVRLFPF